MKQPTTPIARFRVKILAQYENAPGETWEVTELSKNTLVLGQSVPFRTLPKVSLWMRAAGKDSWREFPLLALRPLEETEGHCTRFAFEVQEYPEFSRCFDFSRASRENRWHE